MAYNLCSYLYNLKRRGVEWYPFASIMNSDMKASEMNVKNVSAKDQKHFTSLGVS